jgi:hypothetical protein
MRLFLCTLLAALLLALSARSEIPGEIHFQYRDGPDLAKSEHCREKQTTEFFVGFGRRD